MTARLERWRSLLAPHQAFLQLLAVFAVFRFLAAMFLQPGGFLTAATPDQFFYYHLAGINAGGQAPFVDYWTEFPPIFPWMVVLATRISLLIPAWSSGIFWFNAVLRWLILAFDALTLILLYATTFKLWNKERALSTAQAFAVLLVPLWVFLGWFDSVVLFFLMLALYGLARHSAVLSGLGIGLGFGAKLFPLAVLPSAVRVFSRRQLIILIGTIIGALVLIFGPFLLIGSDHTLAFFRTLQGRSSWETVWALLDGYEGWGVVSSLAERNEPLTAGQLVPGTSPSSLPWLVITGLFGIVGLAAWLRPIDWKNPRRSVAFSALTFGMMLLYAKGYSPQWAVYLTTLSLLVLGGWRGVMYAIALDILTVLEWPVAFVMFDGAPGFLRAVIITRTIVTVILCVEFAGAALTGERWMAPIRRWLPRVAGIGFAAALLIGVFPASRTYRDLRRSAEPAEIILNNWEYDLESTQLAITTQPIIIQRLSALIPEQVTLRQMPNGLGESWVEADDWLIEMTTMYETDYIWFIEERNQQEYWRVGGELMRALTDRHCWTAAAWYDTTRATAFSGVAPAIVNDVAVDFEDRVVLTGFGTNQAELPYYGMQCVSLRMRVADPEDMSLELELTLTTPQGGRLTGKRLNIAEHMDSVGYGNAREELVLAFAFLGDHPVNEIGVMAGIYDTEANRWLSAEGSEDEPGTVLLGTFTIE